MNVTLDLQFAALLVYMLVFCRFAGMFAFNPMLVRSNVPARIRVALALFFTLLVAPMQPIEAVYSMSDFEYLFAIVREVLVGAVYGYVFQIYYNFLHMAGDLIDTDIGLSMAKIFDPSSNIQASATGRLFNLIFVLYFFSTGSHLALFRMYVDSFNMIPVGAAGLSSNIIVFAIDLFSSLFSLILRLSAPIMVAAVILQAALGILMKFIPSISVFVINVQLRVLLGLILLFMLAPFIGQFINNYIDLLFTDLTAAVQILATGSI